MNTHSFTFKKLLPKIMNSDSGTINELSSESKTKKETK
jgi:hypothetical protein